MVFDWLFGGSSKRSHKERVNTANNDHQERMQDKRNAHDSRMRELDNERGRIEASIKKAEEATKQAKINADKEIEEQKIKMQRERKEREDELKKQAQINEKFDKDQKREQLTTAKEYVKTKLDTLNNKITQDQQSLQDDKKELGETEETLKKIDEKLNNWQQYKNNKLKQKKSELENAQFNYQRDDLAIKAAINKTGQHEESVGKFLSYANNIVNCALVTTASTNQLQAKISNFGELIQRLCQTKLTIESYFGSVEPKLKPFIPIFVGNDITNLNELKCKNENEFEKDILEILRKGLAQESKDDDSKTIDTPEDKPFDQLLTQWKLKQFIEKFEEDGYDDPSDWKDLTDDELKELGLKGGHIKKFRKGMASSAGDDLISPQQRRLLKHICLESETTWAKPALQKEKKVVSDLMIASPVLQNFFGVIDMTVKQAQILLEFPNEILNNAGLNKTQLKAIKYAKDEFKQDEKEFEQELEDEIREKWTKDSKCKIFSDSEQKWYEGTVIKITNDKEGEWLGVGYRTGDDKKEPTLKQIQRYAEEIKPTEKAMAKAMDDESSKQLKMESNALIGAAIVKFNIVESLRKECMGNNMKLLALDLAEGVERGCVQLFQSQGIIRQSIILARNILQFKPADLSDPNRQKLWKSVDNGVVNIYKTSIDLVKVSEKYFGFFLRFKQSFGFFVSCYQNKTEEEKQEISLIISMEHLQKDIREFDLFQKAFIETVSNLEMESTKVIQDCVETTIGAEQFEKARTSREKTKKELLNAQKAYDEIGEALKLELEDCWTKKIEVNGKFVKLKHTTDMLTKSIQTNQEYQKMYSERLGVLQKTQI